MNQINYEQDYYQWTQAMVKALKQRDYTSIDWENLIEEIDDIGKSQKRAVESLLMRLTEHLLKLKYWDQEKTRNAKHWRSEIVNFRILLHKRLKDSPSLKAKLDETYEDILPGCKRSVEQLFNLPENIKLDLNHILDEDWFPDSDID